VARAPHPRGGCVRACLAAVWILLAAVGCPDLGSRYVEDDPAPVPEAPAEDDEAVAGGAEDAPAAEAEVLLRHLGIAPLRVVIRVGGSVTWRNLDGAEHVIASGSPESPTDAFGSLLLAQGDSFRLTFVEPGSYEYFCSTHANVMRGAVVEVVEASGE
jgi:plastocyanin